MPSRAEDHDNITVSISVCTNIINNHWCQLLKLDIQQARYCSSAVVTQGSSIATLSNSVIAQSNSTEIMPKIISGLNSAAATLSSLSVAVHTHTLSSCAVDNFLHDHSRCRHAIIGDGNCLFWRFYFILVHVWTEENHKSVRAFIVHGSVLLRRTPDVLFHCDTHLL